MKCWASMHTFTAPASTKSYREIDEEAISEKRVQVGEKVREEKRQDTTQRLSRLRDEMVKQQVEIYVIPTADEFGSEYVGARDQRRAFISGFTGSAGVAVVTLTEALLFTDSRYFIQAAAELDCNWTLVKVVAAADSWSNYLINNKFDKTIGMDPRFFSYREVQPLVERLNLVFSRDNLVDRIWLDKPLPRPSQIVLHPIQFAGRSAQDKINDLRVFLSNQNRASNPQALETRSSYLVHSLNNIAWILNLRGSDIPYNPVFQSYFIVGMDSLTLFVDPDKVTRDVEEVIRILGGKIQGFDQVWSAVENRHSQILSDSGVSWAFKEILNDDLVIVTSPIDRAESIKNEVEIQGFRNAYLRDAVAWVRWIAWLEGRMSNKKASPLSEWDAAEMLTRYREIGEHFKGLAYDNISATGANAALPHYEPTATKSSIINSLSPYLNDSGAQYLDGTIDTTRTYHFGVPTKRQRIAFTRVLQGHISIDRAKFPRGTTGGMLDTLARQYLWQNGLNYLHGTGHGIGEYLSVHEGPHGIAVGNSVPLVPGNITSNEPAYYEEGAFGIRIESVLLVRKVDTDRNFGGQWLGFERLTQIPIQASFVDHALLSKEEKRWLEGHNRECMKRVMPLLGEDKRARKWLKRQ